MDSSSSQLPGTPIGKMIPSRSLRSKVIACSTPNTSSKSLFLLNETSASTILEDNNRTMFPSRAHCSKFLVCSTPNTSSNIQFSLDETTESAVLEDNDESSSSGGFSDSKIVTFIESEAAMNPSFIYSDEISANHTPKELTEMYTDNHESMGFDKDNFVLSEKVMKNGQGNNSETLDYVLKQESQNNDIPKEFLKNCSVQQIEVSKRQENQKLLSNSGAVGSVINKLKLEEYEIVECSVADSESMDLEIPDIGVLEETSDLDYPGGSDLSHNRDSIGIHKNGDTENMQTQSNLVEMLKANPNEKLVKFYETEVLLNGKTSVKCDMKINEDILEADILPEQTFGKIKEKVDISVNLTEVSTVIINKELSDPLYNYAVAEDSNKSNDLMDNTLVNEGSVSVPLDNSKEIISEIKIESELPENCGGKSNFTLDMQAVDHVGNIFLEKSSSHEFNQNSLNINSIEILSDEHKEKLDDSLYNYTIKCCFNCSIKNISAFENSSVDINSQIKDKVKKSSLSIESDHKTTNEINNNETTCENDRMCINSNRKSLTLLDSCSLKVSDEVSEVINSKRRPCKFDDEVDFGTNNDIFVLSNNEFETMSALCTTSPGNTSKKENIKIELDCGFEDLSYSSKHNEEEAQKIYQSPAPKTDMKVFEVEESQFKGGFEENQPKFSGPTNPTKELANSSVCNGRIVKKVIKIGKDCMYYLSRENCKDSSISTNDTFNTIDEASFGVTSDITGKDYTMNKVDKQTSDCCEISRNNLIESNNFVHLPVDPSGSMTSVFLLKTDGAQRNEAGKISTLSEVSCFSESKMDLMITIDEVHDSKDVIVDASTSKCNFNHILNDNKTTDDHLSGTNKFLPSTSQEFNRSQVNEIEKLNKIAMEEINMTVTEEDMYYSKKDEISICFETRNEHLMALDEVPKIVNKAEKGSLSATSKRFDISSIREKHEEEIKPPPAKKICLEVPQRSTDRPLEVFVSNNACENADNNNPQWQFYKKLTNDELRYECVRKNWLNPQIPNVNSNLSTYNWRARNGLQPLQVTKNDVKSYYNTMGGSVHDIFTKARDNAKTLFDQKVRTLELKKDQRYNEADEKLHFSLCRSDPTRRYLYYNDYRQELDTVQNECASQYESLLIGLEERIASIDKAEEEVTTVSNFYKGLDANGDISRTHLTPWQLCCWYDREDTLNNYEVFYSENN